jgi:hypothetical protein
MRRLSEDWPEARLALDGRHALLCVCDRCRVRRANRYVERLADQSLSTALRHAQDGWEDGWEAGRRSTTALPGIGVAWSAPVSLAELAAGAPTAAAFRDPGKLRLYRIHLAGSRRPLYLGMVSGARQSVARRLTEHLAGRKVGRQTSETRQLYEALRGAPDRSKVLIRYADMPVPPGFRHDRKFLHGVEMLLQAAMRPTIHNPGSLTFEDPQDLLGLEAGGAWRHRLRALAARIGLATALAGSVIPGPTGKAVRDVGRAVAMLGGQPPERRKYPVDSPPRSDRGAGSPPPN